MKVGKGGNFKAIKLPEPQTTLARCYSVVDLGTYYETFKNTSGDKRKLHISFELPMLLGKFSDDKPEQPFAVFVQFNATTNSKGDFYKFITAWRGKELTPLEQDGFDPMTMIGKTAYLSFTHAIKHDYKGKELAEITNENARLKLNAIMQKPKDIPAPEHINEYVSWDWDKVEAEGFAKYRETFEKLPKWMQKRMTESKEFKRFCGDYKVDDGSGSNDEQGGNDVPAQTPKLNDGEW